MKDVKQLSLVELEEGLDEICRSPKDNGALEMIVRRPAVDEREVLEAGELELEEGLKGDNWKARGSSVTADGSAHPDAQLNVMNSRVIALLAQDSERWQLAGDQLYVDLDLSAENLPPGSQLAIGSALIEVTALPHTGCKKFAERFGADATRFVNSPEGKELKLRGVNARIVRPGTVRIGDAVRKV
jgi:hypothetical protein